MSGSKVFIRKQDPSVTSIGIKTSYIPFEIQSGPKDQDIIIRDLPEAYPDQDNNFLFDPQQNPKEFDAVHTFTIVKQVITMYRRALRRYGRTKELNWQWTNEPINVYPQAGVQPNAYYSRSERALKFFYFHPDNLDSQPPIYTCRSFDIVSHEVGHAILDSFKPNFFHSWHPQTGGIHESFADLTAIFTMLDQMDMCEAIIAESKANLHAKTFFPALAEEFGEALGRPFGLRNADNDLKLSEVSHEVHDISRVFTGAVYDILADLFDSHKDPEKYDHAESLYRIGRHVADLVTISILDGPEANATYQDIANKMIETEQKQEWKDVIRNQFEKREILGAPQFAAVHPQSLDWNRCCATMRRQEYTDQIALAIDNEQSVHV